MNSDFEKLTSHLRWMLMAVLAASCGSDDKPLEEPQGGGTQTVQTLQLSPYNQVKMEMESSDETFGYDITVERQGTNTAGQLTASLALWDEEDMRRYNEGKNVTYTLLPSQFYTLDPKEVTLAEGETQQNVALSLTPSEVFSEMKKTRARYAIAMTLESKDAKISATRDELILTIELNYPTLEFDLPPYAAAPTIGLPNAATEVEVPTRFTYNKGGAAAGSLTDFVCPLTVPDNAAELVNQYNQENHTSHILLPEGSYDLGEGISYSTGDQEKIGHFTVFREGLDATATYLLPVTFGEPTDEGVMCTGDIYYVAFKQVYTNPVLNNNCPDPTVLQAPDGNFYLYCTEGSGGNGGMGIYRSSNLMEWEYVSRVIQNNYLSWTDLSKSDLWAPEARYINGKYYVYFSVSSWGGLEGSSIGVATGDSPAGPFTDSGKPLITYDDLGVLNSIDPFYWEENGKKYMFWGSFHGIYVTELTDDGLSVRKDTDGNPTLLQKVAGSQFEATCIYKKDGYYYLMASVGSCCDGEDSSYRVVVGRSTDLFGPYVDKSGGKMLDNKYELVVNKNDKWVGPGHNSQILLDDAGNEWMIYHGRPMPGAEIRAVLLDRLQWTEDGWPYIEGGVPSSEAVMPIFN